MRKLCLSAKFPRQEIKWNYGIFRSVSQIKIVPSKLVHLFESKHVETIVSARRNGNTLGFPFQLTIVFQFLNTTCVWLSKYDYRTIMISETSGHCYRGHLGIWTTFFASNEKITSMMTMLQLYCAATRSDTVWLASPILLFGNVCKTYFASKS